MKRVPIKVARDVAKANGFRQVILCAWDGDRTHIVTYGVSVEDCAQAAQGGNRIKEALGWPKDLRAEPSRVQKLQDEIVDLKARLAAVDHASRRA
jgi:hypothetical protein